MTRHPPAPAEQMIGITDGELFVACRGSGPPLVLIHGMATDTRLWTPQVAELANHFKVISYDMRGFGRSSRPGPAFRAEDDLAELLEQ
ncbi:MAG: alpha/beta fold hydrolase, partial [Gammaproteobacteria bacterium]